MKDIIGDYRSFFADLKERLDRAGIDVSGRAISHLAFRTRTLPEYEKIREQIREYCCADVENFWNGRPICKLLLQEALPLEKDAGASRGVSLIELIPPPHQRDYPMGLEHCGIVIGDRFEEFVKEYESVLSGRQDQGPFCQPAYVTFENNRTVKFYRYSLKDVVEKEDRAFIPYDRATVFS